MDNKNNRNTVVEYGTLSDMQNLFQNRVVYAHAHTYDTIFEKKSNAKLDFIYWLGATFNTFLPLKYSPTVLYSYVKYIYFTSTTHLIYF